MNEEGGFIVTIKTSERVDFDRLPSRYNIDIFRHSAMFDEQKKQFIIDGIVSLEQIGQLVRDGYIVEVKKYHVAQGLPASQIVNFSEWLKANEEREEELKRRKAADHEGGNALPPGQYLPAEPIYWTLWRMEDRHPDICKFATLPELSHEARPIGFIKIGVQTSTARNAVLLTGGLHARELVNPDILISLGYDLIWAYEAGMGIRYGGKLFSSTNIKKIMESLYIFILPVANPDGREHAMNTRTLWRMNRNPNGGRTCSVACPNGVRLDGKGVDCNRNFDFLWSSGIHTTSDPCLCSQLYRGTGAFSEPESRNVRWLLDNVPEIDTMVDVHSYAERVLYPWQIDENQVRDINMNFWNSAYNGRRGVVGDSYKEYIPQSDLNRYVLDAGKVRDAINAVRGGGYVAQQGPYFPVYPASATSTDYAYSRNFIDSNKRKVFALAFETGKSFNPIHPENGEPTPTDGKLGITKEVSAGLIQFMIQRLNA